jgi:hypothetical protein
LDFFLQAIAQQSLRAVIEAAQHRSIAEKALSLLDAELFYENSPVICPFRLILPDLQPVFNARPAPILCNGVQCVQKSFRRFPQGTHDKLVRRAKPDRWERREHIVEHTYLRVALPEFLSRA